MLKKIGIVLAGSLVIAAAPAAAVGKAPITIEFAGGCDDCSITATWRKNADGKAHSKTKQVEDNQVKFKIRRRALVYFTGVSMAPSVSTNAATILVTQYVGSSKGSTVSPQQSVGFNAGAYYCMVSKRKKITAQAVLVPDGDSNLLSLWANPQLAAGGPKATGGYEGIYGTQNTLPCN